MLGRRIAILLLIPRLIVGSDPSKFGLPARQTRKWKRDLSGLTYAHYTPHYIRLPPRIHKVIRPANQDELLTTLHVPIYKPSFKKNTTKVKGNPSNVYSSSYRHIPNINVQLTDIPLFKSKPPVFVSNRIPGESRLSGLYVNPNGNLRSSGDRLKYRGSAHLHVPPQKQESAYDPNVYGYPISPGFFGDSTFSVASQPNRNSIYKTRNQELKGSNAEINFGAFYQPLQYASSGKAYQHPYSPLPVEFTGLDNPRGLTIQANANSQGKPVYAYDFAAYELPNVGNTNAFKVQPADSSPEQLSLDAGQDSSQFSIFASDNEKIKKVSSPENYQLLSEQPQLLFDNVKNWPVAENERTKISFYPFEEIRTDVEVIDKKRRPTPRPIIPEEGDDEPYDGSREDDEERKDDEGPSFKLNEYSPSSADEDDYTEKYVRSREKGKKDPGFDIYDKKFGALDSKEKVNDKGTNSKESVDGSVFDAEVDEYLSHFYDTPLHQSHTKSTEELLGNDKQESDEKHDYREVIKQSYGSSEEEFEKSRKPIVNKKNTSIISHPNQKGKKAEQTVEPLIRIRESRRGNEKRRHNYAKKPYTFGERFPQEDEF